MRRMRSNALAQRGVSLIEMSVGMAASALIGLAVWGLYPKAKQVAAGDAALLTALQAQAALDGFIQRQFRLPCPDTDGDGRENCTTPSAVGSLPWRDLGLSADAAVLRYGVNSVSLLIAGTSYVPNLPLAPLGPTGNVLVAYDALANLNGLDLCQQLRQLAAGGGGQTAGGVPYAYALVHPGANRVFDGTNGTASFALPGQPHQADPVYDDSVWAVGVAELSGTLNCPQRLADAQVAARSAYASYDIWRNAEQFYAFRSFAHQVRQTNVVYAGVNVAIATLDIINAVATGVTAAAITAALPEASIATDIIALGLATTAAVAATGAAGYSLVTAIIAEIKANEQKQAAQTELNRAAAAYLLGYSDAVTADQKGLRP